MRIVSLGFPLPNPQVDNHSIANAPSLFEYDACVIDPRVTSTQIEEILQGSQERRTPEGIPLQAGASGAFHYGLGELLQQRREELTRLLQRGGAIIVFGRPNVPHPGVTTLPGVDRYYFLPAAPGVVYRPPQLVPGDGERFESVDPAHPWSVYLSDLRGSLRYGAHWNTDAIPDFDTVGSVFARSEGGAVVGVDFQVGPGRIIFLPPLASDLSGSRRKPATDSIIESIQRTLEDRRDEPPPSWVSGFDLPGVSDAEGALSEAQERFGEAESHLVEARAHFTDASKYHGLLWRAGHYSFEPLVRDAFRELGFTVAPELDRPAELANGDEVALLEIDGSTGTVAESAYLALQRRVEKDFLATSERRKGIVVVNGERLMSPGARKQPYSDTLLNACNNFGYALITADALFALVTYALEGADAATLAGIRETILNTDGLLEVEETDEDEETVTPATTTVADDSAADDSAGDDHAADEAADEVEGEDTGKDQHESDGGDPVQPIPASSDGESAD
ncbi:MAG: hypothetical protein O6913_11315 [Chloroflexi bacterium]|nr:hypothetical protein [Chloroflexota bacterium]